LVARWRYDHTDVEWDASYGAVRALLLERFASIHSLALQQTLYGMGEAVLASHPEVAEIRFAAPNRHHFLVDLTPFGLDNPNEVFYAADRPYGLIEAAVVRDDASDAGSAWHGRV
jgi:urate oxidase